MSWADRPYSQDDPPRRPAGWGSVAVGMPPWTPVVRNLIIANIAIHVLRLILRMGTGDFLGAWGAMVTRDVLHGQVWRLVSYQYLHSLDNLWHIIFNMLGLYFLGPYLERRWGGRRFFVFYTLAGVSGALVYMLLSLTPLVGGVGARLVGASGSVLGVVGACAVLFPHINLIVFLFPIPIRFFCILIVVVYVLNILQAGVNAGGDAAHLGGLAWGVLWALGAGQWITRLAERQRQQAWQRRLQREREEEQAVDRILEKVSRHGIESLTRREKALLQKVTRRQRERDEAIRSGRV